MSTFVAAHKIKRGLARLARRSSRSWSPRRSCTGCGLRLGRITNRGANCPECGRRACKWCRHYSSDRAWRCLVCREMEFQLSHSLPALNSRSPLVWKGIVRHSKGFATTVSLRLIDAHQVPSLSQTLPSNSAINECFIRGGGGRFWDRKRLPRWLETASSLRQHRESPVSSDSSTLDGSTCTEGSKRLFSKQRRSGRCLNSSSTGWAFRNTARIDDEEGMSSSTLEDESSVQSTLRADASSPDSEDYTALVLSRFALDFDEPALLEPLPHNICLRSTRLIKMILQHIRSQNDRPSVVASPFKRHGSCPVNFLKKHHNVLRTLQTLREEDSGGRKQDSVRDIKKSLLAPSKTMLTRSTSLPSLQSGYDSEDSSTSQGLFNAISMESDLWKLGEATPACYHIEKEQESQSDIQIDTEKLVPEGDDYRLVFISSPGSSQIDDEETCKECDDISMYSGSTDYAAIAENASGIFFMDDMDWDLSHICGQRAVEDEMICTVLFSSPLRDSERKTSPSKNNSRKSSLHDSTGLVKADMASISQKNEPTSINEKDSLLKSRDVKMHTHQVDPTSKNDQDKNKMLQQCNNVPAQQKCKMLCQEESNDKSSPEEREINAGELTNNSATSIIECSKTNTKSSETEDEVLLQNQLLSCDQLFDSILAEDEEAEREQTNIDEIESNQEQQCGSNAWTDGDVIDPELKQGWAGKTKIIGMAADTITTTMDGACAPASHPRPPRHQTSSSGDIATSSALLCELQEDALISQLKILGDECEYSTMSKEVKVLDEEKEAIMMAGLTPSSCLELPGEAAASHSTGCVDLPTSAVDSSADVEQSECNQLNTGSSSSISQPMEPLNNLDGSRITNKSSLDENRQLSDTSALFQNNNVLKNENEVEDADSKPSSSEDDNEKEKKVSLIDTSQNINNVLQKGENTKLETDLLAEIHSDMLELGFDNIVTEINTATISSEHLPSVQQRVENTEILKSNENNEENETFNLTIEELDENNEATDYTFSEKKQPAILHDLIEKCRENYLTSEPIDEACSTSALEKYFVSFDKTTHSKAPQKHFRGDELDNLSVPAGLESEKNDLFYQTDPHTKVFYWNDSENTESSEGEEEILDEESSSEDEATYLASSAGNTEPYYGHMSYSLHTIVEESCEESERDSRVATPTNIHPISQLEDYFNHTMISQANLPGVKNQNKDDCAMSDTYSETSGSVCSDTNDDVAISEQAASRLEQYFTRGILGGFVYQDEGEISDESGGLGSEMGDKTREDNLSESRCSVTPQPESEEEEENFDTIKRKKPTFECAPEIQLNNLKENIKLTRTSDFSSTESILANISTLFESIGNISDSENSEKKDENKTDGKNVALPKSPEATENAEVKPKKAEEPDSISIKSGYSDEDAAYIMNKLMIHLSETSKSISNDSEENLVPTLELLKSEIYRLMQTVSPMSLSEPSGSSCGSSTIGSNNSDYGSDTLESAEYTTTDDDDAHAERIGSFRSNNSFTFRLSSLRRNNSDKSRGGDSSDSTVSEETLYICKQLMSSLKELAGTVTADKNSSPQKLLGSDSYSQARTYIRDQIVALMHTVTASRNSSPVRERKQTELFKPNAEDLKIIKEESPLSSVENLKDSPAMPKSLLNQDSYAEAIIIDDEGISVEDQKQAAAISKSSESLSNAPTGEIKNVKGKSSNLSGNKKEQSTSEKSSFKQFNFLPSSLRRMSKASKSSSIEYLQTATYPLSIMKSHPDLSPKPQDKKNPENRLSFHADSLSVEEDKTSSHRKCLSDERMNKSESKCLPLQIWKKPQSSSSSKINDGKNKMADQEDEGCEMTPSTFNLNAKEKASSENNLFLRDTHKQKKDGKVSTTKSVGNISDLENSGSKSSCRDTGYYSFKSSDDSILSLGDSAASQTSSASLVQHRSPTSTETIPEVEEPPVSSSTPPGALCDSLKSKNVSLSSSNIPEQVWGTANKSSTLPSSIKNKFSLPPSSTSRFRPFVSSIFSTSGVLRKLAALKDDNSSNRSHSGFKKRLRLPSTGSEELRTTGLGSMPQLTLTDYSDQSTISEKENAGLLTEESDQHLIYQSCSQISLSSFGSRSESLSSVYSAAGGGRYGTVAVSGEVLFGMAYKDGVLEVLVQECRNLAPVDARRHRSDPYVKVYLLPDKTKSGKRKTKVKKHTLNPVYNEILRFPISAEELELRTLWLSVWHSDIFGRNDFLGEVLVGPEPLNLCWLPLQERLEMAESQLGSRGQLYIALRYVPPSTDCAGPPTGSLQVLVKEAHNLTATRANGTSDPFCKSYLLPDRSKSSKQKTGVAKRTVSPKWYHTFSYDGLGPGELHHRSLELTLWDRDKLTSNDFLGGVRLSLGLGQFHGQEVSWMDSRPEEAALWQQMLEKPNTWVDASLPLRASMQTRLFPPLNTASH